MSASETTPPFSLATEPSSVTSSSVTRAVVPSVAAASPSEPVRLWVGNIQPHVAEYQLLQLARPLGTITRFDFMLHLSGPLAGKPRGYAFISYDSHWEAERARQRLAGALLGGGRLNVRWAHEPAPAGGLAEPRSREAGGRPPLSTQTQIRAIEAKLLNMTSGAEQFDLGAGSADVKRLPKVKGPLSLVNSSSKRAQQTKPYARQN